MDKPEATKHLGVILLFCAILAVVHASAVSALPALAEVATGSVVPTSSAVPTTTPKPFVVVIDSGHQAQADLRAEPVGPGSKTTKPRVEGGATGVATHRPESLDNLQIALKLRDDLVKRGVKVIMIRTTQKVDVPNSGRAQIANKAHADLFIRLHCDSSGSSSTRGVLTLTPANNKWTHRIVKASARAGRDVQAATLRATHDIDRGITRRGDLSGFNWSKVPTTLVEMGVMSNPAEDRKLASVSYQKTIATGIAKGIMAFLSGK